MGQFSGWKVFQNLNEAERYIAAWHVEIPPGAVTVRWADPVRTPDGAYAVPAYPEKEDTRPDPPALVPESSPEPAED